MKNTSSSCHTACSRPMSPPQSAAPRSRASAARTARAKDRNSGETASFWRSVHTRRHVVRGGRGDRLQARSCGNAAGMAAGTAVAAMMATIQMASG
eukprot:259731-Chlamydomonas_euryale.AAC.7